MEQYKEKLKLYNILLGIGAFILAVFSFLAVGRAGVRPVHRRSNKEVGRLPLWSSS